MKKLAGSGDSVLVADPDGNIVFSRNADQKRVPASVFKVITALAARHYLGDNYRFTTEFYMDPNGNLKIKGYGDPLLISETVADAARQLAPNLKACKDIILDSSWFGEVTIPGVSATLNPYDAPNGALCVNFNTVSFRRANGQYSSAEPQTPLLPFVMDRVRRTGFREERIVLSAENDEITLYAGHLFRYFLEKEGVTFSGTVRTGLVNPKTDRRIFTYTSPFSLDEVITKLLQYSNNFIANQIFISAGTKVYGPPGTLEKGRQAVDGYLRNVLGIRDVSVDEGSGISRQNRISATDMMTALEAFQPHRELMRHDGHEYYKTGHLNGVRTRVGYVESRNGGFYRFAVLVNTPGKSTNRIMATLLNLLY